MFGVPQNDGHRVDAGQCSRRARSDIALDMKEAASLRRPLSSCASRLGGDGLCHHLGPNWPAAQLVNRKSSPTRIVCTSCLTVVDSERPPPFRVVNVLSPNPK